MKKLLAAMGIIALMASQAAFAKTESEEPTNVMTIKNIEWKPEIETKGENKLLKIKVTFHYEGELMDIGYGSEYYFNISCSTTRTSRGGTKYLFYENRDLLPQEDEETIEGPKDFSAEFVFTFTPAEFLAAGKRSVGCGFGYANDDFVKTEFAWGVDTYLPRLKARGNVWKKSSR